MSSQDYLRKKAGVAVTMGDEGQSCSSAICLRYWFDVHGDHVSGGLAAVFHMFWSTDL